MPDKIRIPGYLFSCLSGALVVLPGMAAASIIESAIDTAALSGRIGLAYGDHTINSNLATGVDDDNYSFQGTAGDQIRVIVSSSTYGFDPVITLREASGATVQGASCNGNPSRTVSVQCTTSLDQTLSSTGVYFLNLSEIGANEAGNYNLSLYQYPPANNWDGIAYDTPLFEQLGHRGDMDFLAFNGAAGTGVKISLASSTYGLDPRLEVWDPSGNLIEDTWCNGNPSRTTATRCSVVPELDLSETGTYKIGLSDFSWNETGGYGIGVSCLYGDCPSALPSAVPIPASIWMFGTGLVGLCLTARRDKACTVCSG